MRRVFGLETEYGFFCRVNGARLPSRENIISYLFNEMVPGARKGNVFLENGGRLYLDSGFHPEYATPEADQVAELVAHDKAGERIVAHLLLRAGRLIHEKGFTDSSLPSKTTRIRSGTRTAATRTIWLAVTSPSTALPLASSPFS